MTDRSSRTRRGGPVYRYGSLNTEFTSGHAACAGIANPGVWTPGLVDCGVFLVWQTGSRGIPCPALDVTFPFLPPGWQAEKVGGGFAMQSPWFLAERLRTENGD